MVIDYLEKLSHGLVASSMLTDDGIIDPRDTRDVIGFCLSIVNNNHIEGDKECMNIVTSFSLTVNSISHSDSLMYFKFVF